MQLEFVDPSANPAGRDSRTYADPPARVLAAPTAVPRSYAASGPGFGASSTLSSAASSTLAAGPAPGLLGGARAIPVAGPAPTMVFDPGLGLNAAAPARDRLSAGGVDVRDEWLAAGLRNPRELAHFLAGKSLAEQELWVGRLAKRAEERGLLSELVAALHSTQDDTARILADDFRAAGGGTTDTLGR